MQFKVFERNRTNSCRQHINQTKLTFQMQKKARKNGKKNSVSLKILVFLKVKGTIYETQYSYCT